jgi:hypothetical protein
MKNYVMLFIFAAFPIIGLTACAPTAHPHLSTWRFENIDPLVQTETRPGYNFASAKTFTVLPLHDTEFSTSLGSIAELQILRVLIYQIEVYGYEFVENVDKADLVFAIDYADNPYRSSYVPPSTVTVPVYVPGQTYSTTSFSNYFGSVYGSGGWASGTGYGTTRSTTTTPGTWTTNTYVREGHTAGAYYPTLSIKAFDQTTSDLVYAASYVGVTQIPDLRIAFPAAASWLISDLPWREEGCPQLGSYRAGIGTKLGTLDGNRYFPVIDYVDSGLALRSGSLQVLDIVTAINGVNMESATFCGFIDALGLDTPGSVTLSLFRGGETITAVVEKRLR